MRSSQASLRLAGGLASAMLVLAGVLGLLVDFLPAFFSFDVCLAMHYFADAALLVLGGLAGVFAELNPHLIFSENAPYLSHIGGRACFYLLMGMYVIGRKPHGWQAWGDFLIGFYTLCVSIAAMAFAYRMNSLPPALIEPVLANVDPQDSEMSVPPSSVANELPEFTGTSAAIDGFVS